MKIKETVLCYLKKGDCYLLLLRNKKMNDLNQGKYIGIGGHLEEGESKEEALLREVKEETGLTLLSYTYHAKILFQDDDFIEMMHLYSSDQFIGDLIECDEGELSYQKIDDLDKLPMWEGDYIFLKRMQKSTDFFELTLKYQKGKLVYHSFEIK